jgi:hypothetical protein
MEAEKEALTQTVRQTAKELGIGVNQAYDSVHRGDAARAFLAKGITGNLILCDGKTGIPRTIVNIEKAAQLRVAEESRKELRFRTQKGATAALTPERSIEAA